MYVLAYYYEETLKDPRRAFEWYMKAAQAGYVDAMSVVADLLNNGIGTVSSPLSDTG